MKDDPQYWTWYPTDAGFSEPLERSAPVAASVTDSLSVDSDSYGSHGVVPGWMWKFPYG